MQLARVPRQQCQTTKGEFQRRSCSPSRRGQEMRRQTKGQQNGGHMSVFSLGGKYSLSLFLVQSRMPPGGNQDCRPVLQWKSLGSERCEGEIGGRLVKRRERQCQTFHVREREGEHLCLFNVCFLLIRVRKNDKECSLRKKNSYITQLHSLMSVCFSLSFPLKGSTSLSCKSILACGVSNHFTRQLHLSVGVHVFADKTTASSLCRHTSGFIYSPLLSVSRQEAANSPWREDRKGQSARGPAS